MYIVALFCDCQNLEAIKINCGPSTQWNIIQHIERNYLSKYEKTWRGLNRILLSERRQWEKATFCMMPSI